MQSYYNRHPFRTGMLIGLVWGLVRHPGAFLGCALILLLLAVFAIVVAWFVFVAWLPWSMLALLGAVGLAAYVRFRAGTNVEEPEARDY